MKNCGVSKQSSLRVGDCMQDKASGMPVYQVLPLLQRFSGTLQLLTSIRPAPSSLSLPLLLAEDHLLATNCSYSHYNSQKQLLKARLPPAHARNADGIYFLWAFPIHVSVYNPWLHSLQSCLCVQLAHQTAVNIPAEDTSCVERVSKKMARRNKAKLRIQSQFKVQNLCKFSQEKGDNFAHKNGCCVLRTSKYVAWQLQSMQQLLCCEEKPGFWPKGQRSMHSLQSCLCVQVAHQTSEHSSRRYKLC